ncbi:MAG: hypothetical protein IJR88_04455 [Clostridia bacterium]|nr:hypothetical protein [Clostridia bacterium]
MKKLTFQTPTKTALSVFLFDLFVTTLFAVALLVSCFIEKETGDPPDYLQYMDALEYIFAGILLSLVSLVAVDAVVRDAEKE